MSYQDRIISSLADVANYSYKSGGADALRSGLATLSVELLAAIADELHELNKRLENGETVQTRSDQTGA